MSSICPGLTKGRHASDLRFDHGEDGAGLDLIAGRTVDLDDGPVVWGPEGVLHLHRLEDDHDLPANYGVAGSHVHPDHLAGHRSVQRARGLGDLSGRETGDRHQPDRSQI